MYMDIIKLYGNIIKKHLDNPKIFNNMIKFGIDYEKVMLKLLPDKSAPKSLRYLNKICFDFFKDPISNPENSAWVNLFAPTEILHSMDIKPLFVEAFSSFMAGFKIEDAFLERAEKEGISESLCSYHKVYLGASLLDLVKKPMFSVTSSMICDANISTFRYLSSKHNIPFLSLDVPYNYSKENLSYLENQLTELIKFIEEHSKKKFDIDSLREVIKKENKTHEYMNEYLKKLKVKFFPNTLTFEMYKIFTSHVFMGTDKSLNFWKMMNEDINSYPDSTQVRILWVHLLPFYLNALRNCFDFSNTYQLLASDVNFDFTEEMDVNNPVRALAQKMLLNNVNGPFSKRADNIVKLGKLLNCDGVITFCHLGCKQTMGGTGILRDKFSALDIPYLSIDGDAIDRRNGQEGQIRTRLEAFLEIIKNRNEGDKEENDRLLL